MSNFSSPRRSTVAALSAPSGVMNQQQSNTDGSGSKSILAERYKTRPCRNWTANGFCPYEERCMFAHGEEELRTKEMNYADGLTTEEAIKQHQREIRLEMRQQQHMFNKHRQQNTHTPPQQDEKAEMEPHHQQDSSEYDSNNGAASEEFHNHDCQCEQCYYAAMQQYQQQQYYSAPQTDMYQHNPYDMGKHSSITPEECTCDDCERTRAAIRRQKREANPLRRAFAP